MMTREYDFQDFDKEGKAIIRVRTYDTSGNGTSVHVKVGVDRDDIEPGKPLSDSVIEKVENQIAIGATLMPGEAPKRP